MKQMKKRKRIANMTVPFTGSKDKDIFSTTMSGAMNTGLTGIMGDTKYTRLGMKKKRK